MSAGGCFCGAVRYEVSGALRPVTYCHCSKCRRWHGHVGSKDDYYEIADALPQYDTLP